MKAKILNNPNNLKTLIRSKKVDLSYLFEMSQICPKMSTVFFPDSFTRDIFNNDTESEKFLQGDEITVWTVEFQLPDTFQTML